MASISNLTGTPHLREARQNRLDARVQQALLDPVQLTPGQVLEHQRFYNGSVQNLDRLHQGLLQGIDEQRLQSCFPSEDDWQVRQATQPGPRDNPEALQLREEYGTAFAEARQERTQATRSAARLGEGQHQAPNQDLVEVSGQSVKTVRADGSSRLVAFDDSGVRVDRRGADGSQEALEQRGTAVGRNGVVYGLDLNGQPLREGPEGLTTVVQPDGSTRTGDAVTPPASQPHPTPGNPLRAFDVPGRPWDQDRSHPAPPLAARAQPQAVPARPAPPATSVDPATIQQISQMTDGAARNRRITDSYYHLSQDMHQLLGADSGANWTTWATWASRRAGQTIRKEDLPMAARVALLALAPAAGMSSEALLGYISDRVAEGNKQVFQEIAPVFSNFVSTFKGDKNPDPQKLKAFLDTIPADKPKLREAFQDYYQARFESDPAKKRQLMVRANTRVGEHEQARLNSYINDAMLSQFPLGPLRPLAHRLITDIMSLQTPSVELNLSHDVPGRPGTAATDWGDYDQRMRFIGAMFDRYHDDPSLFNAP